MGISKETEPALQVLAAAIDSIPDPAFVIDRAGVVVGWNKAIEELSCVDRRDILGKGDHAYSQPFFGQPCPDLVDLLFHEENKSANRYSNIVKEPDGLSGETFAPHAKGGKGAWLWARAGLVFQPGQNEPVGAVEVFRDISQQKGRETKLRMAEAISKDMADFFDNVVQGANVWIVYTDFQGCIILWNECAERISGYSAGEVIGRSFRELVYPEPEYRQKVLQETRAALGEGGQIRDFRTTVTCRNGEQRILSWNIARLSNGTEEDLGYLQVGMDITEIQEAQEHISRLNKLLEAFYAISQQIVKAGDTRSLLLGACRSLVQTRDHVLACCSLLDDHDQTVETVTVAGEYDSGSLDPENALQGFDDLPIASVIRTQKPYVCQDLYLEREFEPWFGETRSLGISSFISVPMRSQGSVVGVLTLFSSENDSMDDHEAALLQELANDLAFAIQSITLKDNLTALQEVSLGITDTQELGTTFERALTACMSLTRSNSGFVFLNRPLWDTGEKIVVELGDKIGSYDEKVLLNIELLIEEVLSTCEPVIKNKFPSPEEKRINPKVKANFSSLMLIPMLHKGNAVGVIGLSNRPGGVSWTDVSLCYPFAAQLALAVKNTELFTEVNLALEEAQENEFRFRTIFETAADLIVIVDPTGKIQKCNNRMETLLGYNAQEIEGQSLDRIFHPEDILGIRRLLEYTRRMGSRYNEEYRLLNTRQEPVDAEINSVILKAKDGDNVLMVIRDISERKKATEQLKYLSLHDAMTGLYNRRYFEEELRRLNINRHGPVSILSCDVDALKLVNDTLGHKKGDELIKAAAEVIKAPFRSSDVIARIGGDEFAVILPRSDEGIAQKARNRILAALDAYNTAKPSLPLSISIGVATSAVEPSMEKIFHESDNAMYKHKASRGLRSREIIVKTLMVAMGEKDFVPGGHIQRVKDLAYRFGESLGLNTSDLDDLSMLAQVHDIGKIGIDEALFLKPGPLTEAQRQEVEKHPEIGRRIAVTSPELERVAEAILQHHEWWNGQGYPRGLKEEEILLNARIYAIIDAYDAMTSPRPYRQAVSDREALQELKDKGGTQFDPGLVARFEKMILAETGQLS